MKKRRYISTVVAIVVLLALAGVAAAFGMGNVDGVWGPIDTNDATCSTWATGPAGGSTDYWNPTTRWDDYATQSNYTTGNPSYTDWNQVRYGDPTDADCPGGLNWKTEFAQQSGFGFDGVNNIVDQGGDEVLSENEPFLLGKFCHFNQPITASNLMEYVDLTVRVDGIACEAGYTIDNSTLIFTNQFTLDETSNSAYPCKYGDTQPCGDQVTVSGSETVQKFVCTSQDFPDIKLEYTIAVRGFIPEADNGCTEYDANKIKYTFFSDEGANNCACLWAEITDYTPTAVELKSFTVTVGFKTAQLAWTTTTEVDNLGFNLYRAEQVDGPKTKLNADLIPSNVYPGSSIGADYTYTDTGLSPLRTYYYWLEDVDISGTATMHGPVEAAGVAGGPKGKQPPPKSAAGRMSVDVVGAVQTGAADSGGEQVR